MDKQFSHCQAQEEICTDSTSLVFLTEAFT